MPGQHQPRHDPERFGSQQSQITESYSETVERAQKKRRKKENNAWSLISLYLTWALPLIVFVPLICIAVIAIYTVGFQAILEYLFDAVQRDENKLLHVVIINALLVISQLLCVPAVLYVLANGFFFGFWEGWVFNTVATIIGALMTLVVTHGCLKNAVRGFIKRTPNMWEVFRICEEEPTGKFLMLFRLIIVIPGFVKNYTLALLEISTLKYIVVCVPDALFAGCFNSYVGHKAFVIGEKLRKENFEIADVFAAFSESQGFVIVVSLFFTGLLSYFAWTEYRRRKDRLNASEEAGASEQSPLVSAPSV